MFSIFLGLGLYYTLIKGISTKRFPWMIPQFYTDTLQALLNRSYSSLEWALSSPPKPHAFIDTTLNSSVLIYSVFTWKNLVKGISAILTGIIVRFGVKYFWDLDLLTYLVNNSDDLGAYIITGLYIFLNFFAGLISSELFNFKLIDNFKVPTKFLGIDLGLEIPEWYVRTNIKGINSKWFISNIEEENPRTISPMGNKNLEIGENYQCISVEGIDPKGLTSNIKVISPPTISPMDNSSASGGSSAGSSEGSGVGSPSSERSRASSTASNIPRNYLVADLRPFQGSNAPVINNPSDCEPEMFSNRDPLFNRTNIAIVIDLVINKLVSNHPNIASLGLIDFPGTTVSVVHSDGERHRGYTGELQRFAWNSWLSLTSINQMDRHLSLCVINRINVLLENGSFERRSYELISEARSRELAIAFRDEISNHIANLDRAGVTTFNTAVQSGSSSPILNALERSRSTSPILNELERSRSNSPILNELERTRSSSSSNSNSSSSNSNNI
jgi:hypothetical protein